MRALVRINNVTPYFERTIDEVLSTGFFNSFDTNVIEKDEEYILEVSVPGMNKKDLNIFVENGVLSVSGYRQEKKASCLKVVSEFDSTSRSRTFLLPKNIREEHIAAECKNGLLKIVIPKESLSSSTKIIKVENVNTSTQKGLFDQIKYFLQRMKYKFFRNRLK